MAKYSDSWADELCVDHWAEDRRWKEGELTCISEWPTLWDYRPGWVRRTWSALSPLRGDSIESFSVHRLDDKPGDEVRVIYINGFLGQADEDFLDWRTPGQTLFQSAASYGVRWESRRTGTTSDVVKLLATEALVAYRTFGASLFWSWYYTALKAADTGRLLAQILMRAPGQQFVLCGHSLGARVIFYALVELAERGLSNVVRTAHLMGGAVGMGDTGMWEKALASCRGGIANYYSLNDDVLARLYVPAMGFLSEPIGRNALRLKGVRNVDVSQIVSGHTEYKQHLKQFASYPFGL